MFLSKKDNHNLLQEAYQTIRLLGLADKISPDDLKKQIEDLSGQKFDQLSLQDAQNALIEFLEEKNIAFIFDWRWQPEDIFAILKRLLPKISYKIEKQEPNEARKEFSVRFFLNGKKVETVVPFDVGPTILANKYINPYLSKNFGKKLVEYDTGADCYGFVLVPAKNYAAVIKSRLLCQLPKPKLEIKTLKKILIIKDKLKLKKGKWEKVDNAFAFIVLVTKEVADSVKKNCRVDRPSLLGKGITSYFNPKGKPLSEFPPAKTYVYLKQYSKDTAPVKLVEAKPNVSDKSMLGEFRVLGSGEPLEMEKLAQKLGYEKWGETETMTKFGKFQFKKEAIFFDWEKISPIGSYLDVNCISQEERKAFLDMLGISEKEVIKKNFPTLLAEKMGLI